MGTEFLNIGEQVQKKYFPEDKSEYGLLDGSIQIHLVDTGDNLPRWWSPSRDKALYEMMLGSNHLSGLAYTATTKLANIPLTFRARDKTITSHVDRADEFNRMVHVVSEGMEGLRVAMKRFILDYLITDNGGFMEIMGDGPPDGPIAGMPWGVRHLDSLRCRRTGSAKYPVAFIDTGKDQKRYKLHNSRVIYLAQQPGAMTRKRGVGFSSMSRSNLLGEVLKSQIVYKLEKMGSRPNTKVFVGSGLPAEKMMAAFVAANELQNQMGLEYFGKNVYIGGEGITLQTTDLNNFDPFDEETGTMMAMYAIAFCWGLKIQEIWPVAGSKASDQVSNMQARGRLPADFMSDLKEQFEHKLCPPYIEASFDYQDDDQDMMQANIRDIRSRSVARVAEYEIVDAASLRRLMMENGEISRPEFVRQQLADGVLEDGTPIAVLFHSTDKVHMQLLKIDGLQNPLLYDENDAEDAISKIRVNKNECYIEIAQTKSTARNKRALESLAALCWLEAEYESQIMKEVRAAGVVADNIAAEGEEELEPEYTEQPEPEQAEEESPETE
jgi:hypothetical protein